MRFHHRFKIPRTNGTLLVILLVQISFTLMLYLSSVTRLPWRENELRLIYPLFVLLNAGSVTLPITLGLLGASLVRFLWVIIAKGRKPSATLFAALLTLACILVSAFAIFIAAFGGRYQHIDSVSLNGSRYNLIAETPFQLRCDPYCVSELVHLFECDFLSFACTLVESPSSEEYIVSGIFNVRAPYRTETIELLVDGDTLLGLINGIEAFRHLPNER